MPGMLPKDLMGVIRFARHAPAADTAAVVTLAAPGADKRHVIRQIDVSYRGGTPTGAGVTIAIGGTTFWAVDLPFVADVYSFYFPWGVYDPDNVNQEVVVTATDPGAATSAAAILNVGYETLG